MKKINKAVLFFLGVITLFCYLFLQISKTEFFSKNLIKFSHRFVPHSFLSKVEFKKVQISLFPFGISFYDFKYKDLTSKSKVNVEAKKFNFYLNLWSFADKKLAISEVAVEDGIFYLEGFFKNKKKNLALSDIPSIDSKSNKKVVYDFRYLKKIFKESIPIKISTLSLRKVLVVVDSRALTISELQIAERNTYFKLKIDIIPQFILEDLVPFGLGRIKNLTTDLKFYQEKLQIDGLKIYHPQHSAELNGLLQGTFDKWQNIKTNLYAKVKVDLAEMATIPKVATLFQASEGIASINLKVSGPLEVPEILLDVVVDKFNTNFAYGDKIKVRAQLKNQKLVVNQLEVSHQKEFLLLERPVELVDLNSYKWLPIPALVILKNYSIRGLLHYIPEVAEPIHTVLSGHVGIQLEKGVLSFNLLQDLKSDKFKLILDAGKPAIIESPFISFQNGKIAVGLKKGDVEIESVLKLKKSELKIKGLVAGKYLKFNIDSSLLQLEDLSPIYGISLKGQGKTQLLIEGTGSAVTFQFKNQFNLFEIFGFQLGSTDSNLVIDLEKKKIFVNDFISEVGKTKSSASGWINMSDEANLFFDVTQPALKYKDALTIYHPLLKDLTFLPENIAGNFNLKYQVSGPSDVKKLKVLGFLSGEKIDWKGEPFYSAQSNFIFDRNIIKMEKIKLLKGEGAISGNFSGNLNTEQIDFEGKSFNLLVEDFDFFRDVTHAKGKLDFWFKGTKLKDKVSGVAEAKAFQLKNNLQNLSNSNIKVVCKENIADVNFSYGNQLNLLSQLNFNQKTSDVQKLSWFKAMINTDTFPDLISLFWKYIDLSDDLKGKFSVKSSSYFNISNLSKLNLDLIIDEFNLTKGSHRFRLDRSKNKINLTEGEIKIWDIFLRNGQEFIQSRASGFLYKNFIIKNDFQFDADFFKILSPQIIKASGNIKGFLNIKEDNGKQHYWGQINTENFEMSHDALPGLLEKGIIQLSLTDNTITVDKFNAKLATGNLVIKGKTVLQDEYPKLDLNYSIDGMVLNLFKQTKMNLSGEGRVEGSEIPYILKGDVFVNSAVMLDSFSDLGANNKIMTDSLYLPKHQKKNSGSVLSFNLQVESLNPMLVKNESINAQFMGKMSMKGIPSSLYAGGKLSLVPNTGKLILGSHEFPLTRGDLYFNEEQPISNPELDFAGSGLVTNYNIFIKINGKVKEFSTDLTSDPALSQTDIFSLLAFGYTQDKSQALSNNQGAAASSLGIGGFLVDKLKINDNLKSSLGLKVSLAPEVLEGGGSYLDGRSNTANSSRVTRATKVQVKKEIAKDVNLAVSSTVGGTIGQRQSMNLNYNINKNVSAEGVYELKTNDEGIEDVIDTSIGGDLKFKWTFK